MSSRLRTRDHVARVALAVLVGAIAFVAFPRSAYRLPDLTVGSVAEADVIAPVRFLVLKDEAARAREAEALAATVKPIIVVRREAAGTAVRAAAAFFARLDSAAASGGALEPVAEAAGVAIPAAELEALARPGQRQRWQAAVTSALGLTTSGFLPPGIAGVELGREVVVRLAGAERVVPAESVGTFSDFLARADDMAPAADRASQQLFVRLVGAFYQPTLLYERDETERRRDALRRSVDSVEAVVLAGQRIVAAHEVVTEAAQLRLEALRRALGRGPGAAGAPWLRALGGIGLSTLIALIFGLLILLFRPAIYTSGRAMLFFAAGFVLVLLMAGQVAHRAPGRVELIPVALPAILFAVLFDSRIAAVAAMALAVLIGVQPGFAGVNTEALFLTFVGGTGAALSMRTIRSRTQVYASLLSVAALYAAAAVVLGAAQGEPLRAIGMSAGLGGINALASAALAMLVLPLAETFTRVTTDLRLLELSDPNHPLLRRLATEAPGTYAHSVAMANLCEAACNAIGANGLLARVGCYYHDVGKLKHPQFFVENMAQRGRNPHEQLTAQQSGAIIRRHVQDGLALAREHRLPVVIQRFIPEHHGTLPISFFLERAREERGGQVNEEDFQYPGPAPQSAETAVALLADSVEASLRVLEDPTPETIRDAIDHLVAQRLEGGQLRDAPLTLRQVETVKREFQHVLGGMYHQRVEYPEESGGITADWEGPRVA